MSTATIQTALAGISYATAGTYTTVTAFQLHGLEFEDYTKFPVIVVVDGPEEDEWIGPELCNVQYHPEVHFFAENLTASNMTTWRENIRDAIMGSATLEAACIEKQIDSVTVDEQDNRKLQHIAFYLTITFDKSY